MSKQTSNYITIKERKTYVIPFIQTVMKKESEDAVKFMKGLNDLIKLLLKTAPESYIPTVKPQPNEIRFDLPNWTDIDTRHRFYLSNEAAILISHYLYKMYWIIFDLHMIELRNVITEKKAVYMFMEIYNQPIDKLDMILKRKSRNKKKLIPKKTIKMSSVFSLL